MGNELNLDRDDDDVFERSNSNSRGHSSSHSSHQNHNNRHTSQHQNQKDSTDFSGLSKLTETSASDLKKLHNYFLEHASHGELNQKQFFELYTSLRYEDPEKLKMLSEYIFKAFDFNRDGRISFQEFAVISIKIP